eukprot:SAG31_NODE_18624_length_629_cov_0.873585_2_plen_24_part_01
MGDGHEFRVVVHRDIEEGEAILKF